MKPRSLNLWLIPLYALIFSACNNRLDVLDGYKENVVVYAVLDPSQPVQYVRIGRVFTNPGASANDIAKIPDSLYFDSIKPVLVELENGAEKRRIPLLKTLALPRDSGLFAREPNYVYTTAEKVSPQFRYRLDLFLPKSGRYVSATTDMIRMNRYDLFRPVSPVLFPRIILIPFDRDFNSKVEVRFSTGLNGKIYDAYFHFRYLEVNEPDTTIQVPYTISWKLISNYVSSDEDRQEIVTRNIPGYAFYQLLMDKIPDKPGVSRRFAFCSLELQAGNGNLFDYMEATRPSIGIVQKESDYSNISGGLGLWASRNRLLIDSVELAPACKRVLQTDSVYKRLKFK